MWKRYVAWCRGTQVRLPKWVVVIAVLGFGLYKLGHDPQLRHLLGLNGAPSCSSDEATGSLIEILTGNRNPTDAELSNLRKEVTLTGIVELSKTENVRHCIATVGGLPKRLASKDSFAISAYLTRNNDQVRYHVMLTDNAKSYIVGI